jgi:enoyl-CoA hydratase/carnithine racemase
MAYETMLYEVHDQVATITLNRPEKLNAYTPRMGEELVEAMRRADRDPKARVIVLTGAGRAFCAGADISIFAADLEARKSPDASHRDRYEAIFSYPRLMVGLSKPTIAAINGFALGVGCTMTLPCDIRIAAEQAEIGIIFGRVGLIAELGSTYLLPRLISAARAAEMMLTGKRFSARECLAMGLVSHVTPGDKLMAKARELADEMLQCSSTSLTYTRQGLHHGLDGTLETAIQFELAALEQCRSSPEHAEYVAAFMEKRKPKSSR